MNDSAAIWSLPWQTLQKDLASRFVAEAAASREADTDRPRAHGFPNSWLVRARTRPAYRISVA